MRLPVIEQRLNEPLSKTRFNPVMVFAARPWRELKRVRFQRDSDQLGAVRVAYFRADGIESKLEWREAESPDDVTLFVDARDAEERSPGAVAFGYAILQALGVREPVVRWRNPAFTSAGRSSWGSTTAPTTSTETGLRAAEAVLLQSHR